MTCPLVAAVVGERRGACWNSRAVTLTAGRLTILVPSSSPWIHGSRRSGHSVPSGPTSTVSRVDDRTWFGIDDDSLTSFQVAFLGALRRRLPEGLRPYRAGAATEPLLLVLDVNAPGLVLVSVGLRIIAHEVHGDRISVHDWSFPPSPTADGFRATGDPAELAQRSADLLELFASRPVVQHEWLHRGRVYAQCYLFDGSGERLAQMYRSDWAPRGQQARLVAAGFVSGQGWVQTEGLGSPDRVGRIRG